MYVVCWVVVQAFLFVFPILVGLLSVPYEISYDQKYVNEVNIRAFQNNLKTTDFKEAMVAENDAEGNYIRKEWKLEHKELYWYQDIMMGIVLGLMFQIFNLFWSLGYNNYN